MDTSSKNITCPVCLESSGTLLVLSCDHCIHLNCASGLNNITCPYCRSNITNWPDYLQKTISRNEKKRKKEIKEELEHETLELIQGQEELIPVNIFELQYMGVSFFVIEERNI